MSINEFTEEKARSLFELAGIKVLKVWRLENRYWPKPYVEEREGSPWFLIKTPFGLVEIGWRKSVINIDYSETPVYEHITQDNVTRDFNMVHAYGYPKAVEYLTLLRERADACGVGPSPARLPTDDELRRIVVMVPMYSDDENHAYHIRLARAVLDACGAKDRVEALADEYAAEVKAGRETVPRVIQAEVSADTPLADDGAPIVYDTNDVDEVTHALTGDEGEDDSVTVLRRFAAYVENVWPGKTAMQVLIELEERTPGVEVKS